MYNTYLGNELEAAVSELVVVTVEERAGDATKGCVLLNQGLQYKRTSTKLAYDKHIVAGVMRVTSYRAH